MVNQVILVGRLGANPELKELEGGSSVCKFSIATTERFKDKNTNEVKENTEWHKCAAWNKLGQICAEHLKKGSLVYVEGKLKHRSWEDPKTSEKKFATEVLVHQVQFLDGKKQENNDEGMLDP